MNTSLRSEYFSLWGFLKNPENDFLTISTIQEKIKVFFSLFILEILLAFFAGGLIKIFGNSELVSDNRFVIDHFSNRVPVWYIISIIVFLVPFVEELIFRFSLLINEKSLHTNVTILITGAILILFAHVKVNWIRIPFLAFGLATLFIYYIKKSKIDPVIYSFWKRRFTFIFYFFVLSYGLVHITNFSTHSILDIRLPLIILPQLILGFFCGYIRIKLGFSWGCLFHFLHNGIFIVPMLIASIS
jgi:hypothetical protein